MLRLPEKYKGHCIEIVGQIFGDPEYSDDGIGIQINTDIKNYKNKIFVAISDDNFEINDNDYVKITGFISDNIQGENAFGAQLEMPLILAKEYKKIDYKDAVSPTLKTVKTNLTKNQHGYYITLQKIEFAKNETRCYVQVKNKGSSTFNVYSLSSKSVKIISNMILNIIWMQIILKSKNNY